MADFAHLHVHSQYSMLDGAIRVKDLVKRTAELGMKAVALTDHNNMHGAIDFYKKAKEVGVKPLLGCELGFVFPGQEKKVDAKGLDRTPAHHMVLIARNMTGYKNLIGLVSKGWIDTPSHLEPRVTLEDLAARRDGIIVLSGCLGGLVPQAVLQYSPKAGADLLATLRDVVEKDMLFVELQNHGLYEQPIVNEILMNAAKDLGIPFVATNDCHYLKRDDSIAGKLLGCIAGGMTLDDYNRTDHGSTEMFLKSPDEMFEAFKDFPDAVKNTMAVLERMEHVDPTHKPMLPNFRDEAGNVVANIDEYFRELARQGLAKRFESFRKIGKKVDENAYRERLEIEVNVINKMGFPGYFLIVQDFINWSKANGIPVGPGRGSGAGSIVAYSLGITDLDPIPYNLLFERFLNPERVSMPDFDVDFCMLKRERSIEYVRQKYGAQSVGQIATFQLLKSKSVVRDVGRALGMPFSEVDAVAKLVPDPVQGKNVSIAEAMEQEPRLKAMYNEGGSTKELLDLAQKVENMNRHAGMHAAGIVISEGPLWETVPVFKGSSGELVTQYAKEEVEYAGLVKFDFLGLTTLTVLDIAVALINKRPDIVASGQGFDHNTIPVDVKDVPESNPELKRKVAETYELLQSGETTGVFQLESTGMQKLFKDLRPKRFEDIVAAVALYRPGPLGTGMVEDFVNRVNGRAKTEYPHPDLEDVLQDTYGVITYQEQVMMIARKMGGYSLGGADMLRRAMGKKKPEEMAKQKSIFVEGAKKNGYDEATAVRIFDLLEYFAGYGFNKCVSRSTTVMDARTGEQRTVGDMFHQRGGLDFVVHALGDDFKLRPRRVKDVVWNGVRQTFVVETALGKRIVATANHPFRTLDGWTRLDELKTGTRIAAPRVLATTAAERWPEHELVVLGGLLSEGNTCHPTCLYYFNNEPALIDDFARAAARFPQSAASVSSRGDGRMEVCVSTGRDARFAAGHRPWNAGLDGNAALAMDTEPARSGAFEWARSLGLLGQRADEKRVPSAAFALCDDDVAVLLGRMWSGDGFFANRTNTVPFYATSSEGLARDVQTLLLRLGIVARVQRKQFMYRGQRRDGLCVFVIGDGASQRFLDVIGPHVVGRDADLACLRAYVEAHASGRSSKDTAPADVRAWVDEQRRESGLTWDALERRSGVSMKDFYGRGRATKRGFRRETVAALAGFFANERLAALASSDVFWDTVVSVREHAVEDVFDLEIEDDHNFVADGLIVHNSHSAAYALITYQTAFLKAHYPAEFCCGTLTSDLGKIEKLVGTIAEARTLGIPVLPPDVNESQREFAVIYDPKPRKVNPKAKLRADRDPWRPRVRIGLGGVRGVGDGAVDAILETRQSGGPFQDLFDFCARVDMRRVNKAVVEALVQCGAFDQSLERVGATRAQAFHSIDQAIERGKGVAKERASGQMGLFAVTEIVAPSAGYPELKPEDAWDSSEQLKRERSYLGFYLSGHPLDRFTEEVKRVSNCGITELPSRRHGDEVTLVGVVEGYREKPIKSGGRMAFFMLEDRTGRVEVIVRARTLQEITDKLQLDSKQTLDTVLFKPGEALLVNGKVQVEMKRDENGEIAEDQGDEEPERKLTLVSATLLSEALKNRAREVHLRLDPSVATEARLTALKKVLAEHTGKIPVRAFLSLPDGATVTVLLPRELCVDPGEAFMSRVEKIFGQKIAELR